jgi:hypothetical protein
LARHVANHHQLLVVLLAEHEAFSMIQIAETVSPIPRTEQLITKQILYGFLGKLRTYKVTTLLTSEFDDTTFSGQKVSEFVCDVLLLSLHMAFVLCRYI